MKAMTSLGLVLIDADTLRDIEDFCDGMFVKSPMDNPAFVAKLDAIMGAIPAKTSEFRSESFWQTAELINLMHVQESAKTSAETRQ